jgi:hypothetical protein
MVHEFEHVRTCHKREPAFISLVHRTCLFNVCLPVVMSEHLVDRSQGTFSDFSRPPSRDDLINIYDVIYPWMTSRTSLAVTRKDDSRLNALKSKLLNDISLLKLSKEGSTTTSFILTDLLLLESRRSDPVWSCSVRKPSSNSVSLSNVKIIIVSS